MLKRQILSAVLLVAAVVLLEGAFVADVTAGAGRASEPGQLTRAARPAGALRARAEPSPQPALDGCVPCPVPAKPPSGRTT
jgi:hypothetical protein